MSRPDVGTFRARGNSRRVLLVGALGFIGSEVGSRLEANGWHVTQLVRRAAPQNSLRTTVIGDLADRQSLRRACSGQDAVINAASYLGRDPAEQHRVNAAGSANLSEAALSAGVSRVVYVSSTSVYGGNVANGSTECERDLMPRSTLSLSRLAAEAAVLANGGVVLRPNLVYGPGDRFFLGPLLQAMGAIGGSIENGCARVSSISVEALATLVAGVCEASTSDVRSQVFHAAHPEPATVAAITTHVLRSAGLDWPTASFTAVQALALLRGAVTKTQIDMVAADNWFDSTLIWRQLGVLPGPAVDLSNAGKLWYGSLLAQIQH